jgi:hypothetical protein
MLRRSSGDVCRDTGVQHPAWHSQHIEMPGYFTHNGLCKFPVIMLADGPHYFSALFARVQLENHFFLPVISDLVVWTLGELVCDYQRYVGDIMHG